MPLDSTILKGLCHPPFCHAPLHPFLPPLVLPLAVFFTPPTLLGVAYAPGFAENSLGPGVLASVAGFPLANCLQTMFSNPSKKQRKRKQQNERDGLEKRQKTAKGFQDDAKFAKKPPEGGVSKSLRRRGKQSVLETYQQQVSMPCCSL